MLSQSSPKTLTANDDCQIVHLPNTVLTPMADFFKMLSEVSRLKIVCVLKSGPKTVTEIIEATGLGQANVSKHLKLLTHARLLNRTQQGVNVVYEIANPVIFPLCDLVCTSLATQIQQQNQELEYIRIFQASKLS